ncbi:hypothetical protein NQ318_014969 [Aromia moschata]|uniref:Uncharacterized protein n=1 Tax=Aromia moschata TaxID=1265417 RepID=A0AAV8YZN7_9CUCU|nr:hypothetical protein NQ318_014969 [Aromia moschata]
MDIEEDIDDPMEIDDSLPAAPIIERKSQEFSLNTADVTDTVKFTEPQVETEKSTITTNTVVRQDETETAVAKSAGDDPDIVILDDDDEPMEANNQCDKNKSVDEPPIKEIIDLVEKPHSSRCVNSACKGDSNEFFSAADFLSLIL